MIDPVIFSVDVLGLTLTLRWYGVLVMLGTLAGAWLAEKEITRRGENGEVVWDLLVWVVPAGIVGARLWYVAQDIIRGNSVFVQDPAQIFKIWEGGLHFFGGLLVGGLTLLAFLRRRNLDPWLFLDGIAPAALIGQAVARPANFINQELYGQPTSLPWGIPIYNRTLPPYTDLSQYPIETTRFHPTFAYEMIWNFLAALLLLWIARQYEERVKPGTIFGGWLVLAGVGRVVIEVFRPDQPKIPGTALTYSALVAGLMALAGAVFLLLRYRKMGLAYGREWADTYHVAGPSPRKVQESSKPRRTVTARAQARAKKPRRST